MANSYSALIVIECTAEETLDATAGDGASGAMRGSVVNATGGRRFSNGTGSGKIGKWYKAVLAFTSGQTKSYDLLAAGSLTTPDGVAIDADELKVMVIQCDTGEFQLAAPAANFLAIFSDASDVLNLNSIGGLRCIGMDFGPDGLDVTTNSKLDLIETGSAPATGSIIFGVAE
jgi:hypothetical protein